MKRFLKNLLCVVAFGLSIATFAQAQQKVTGIVKDAFDAPIPGVAVVASATNAAITDADGKYSLTVQKGQNTLEFSCLGYTTVTVAVDGKNVIDVIMAEDNLMLEETVVVGYGTQKKVNLTGAVTSIDFSSKGQDRAIVSTSAALAGLAPGMNITQSSGQPGSDAATIRLRGNGSFTGSSSGPLVLVDGIEWSMDNINPNDIATISVLKDAASTAIYGTRAANGVILITTKNGSEGKAKISYSFKGMIQSPYNNLHFVSDYARHMELINESCENMATTPVFSQGNIDAWREAALNPNAVNEKGIPNYVLYPNTDWFSEIFETGFSQEHNVSISGGGNKVNYLISLGYLDNQGVMSKNGLDSSTQKINVRANIEADVTSWFTTGVRIFGQQQNYGLANVSNAFSYLYQTTPGIWPGVPNAWGIPALSAEESSNANNIFAQSYGSGGYNQMYRINASLYAKLRPVKGLSIEATVNFSPTFGEKHTYSRENGRWNYVDDVRHTSSDLANATASNTSSRTYNKSAEILARYNKTIGDHEFGILAGYSAIEYRTWSWGVTRKGATDWTLNDLGTYETLNGSSSSAIAGWGLRSYFGRLNYSYKGRYLVEANLRADGSSRFGRNNRYGIFPSVSAGWRISEEEFMSDTKSWLSNLKLRASWGKAGNNQGIGNYAWQATYATQNVVVDGSGTKGLYIASLSNDDLQWETTTTTDIGIDAGFFNNRLTAEFDFYNKNTTDILYTPPIYMTMGEVTGVPSNRGSVYNRGVELALGWKDAPTKNFSYFVGVNASYNKNMVTKFKGELKKGWNEDHTVYSTNYSDVTASFGSGRICEGHALGEHYLRSLYRGTGAGYTGGEVDPNAGPVDGMIRTPEDFAWVEAMMASGYTFSGNSALRQTQLWYGDLIYADRDGDGQYGDDDDMDFNGHTSTPSYNLGINLGFTWKDLDFSMTWVGAFDFWIYYNSGFYNGCQTQNGHGVSQRIADDHYFYNPNNPDDPRTNINGTYPRLTYGNAVYNRVTSDFYEYKGDYFKLKNIQLGYSLPSNLTKKFFVQQLRFFASGENLLTITNYPGLDPEKGSTIGYPLMRQVTLGVQITF